ncbi:MAG TPA: NYN domain-containing protein [Allosphingosinicella sp.]
MTDSRNVQSGNVALLIDADNASPESLEAVLAVLAELGTVNIRRAYGNWQKPALKGWSAMVNSRAIEPQQQFDLTKGKSSTDMKLIIDTMDLLYRGHVDGFGIMSSDSDFMPLATRIRQDGLPVYGFGTSRTPESFQQACTRFIDTAALTAALKPSAEQGVAATKRPVDAQLRALLAEAYEGVRHDEKGFASLSAVGQHASNRSSFDARNYGFKRLSDLVASLPGFEVERREGGSIFVRRID